MGFPLAEESNKGPSQPLPFLGLKMDCQLTNYVISGDWHLATMRLLVFRAEYFYKEYGKARNMPYLVGRRRLVYAILTKFRTETSKNQKARVQSSSLTRSQTTVRVEAEL